MFCTFSSRTPHHLLVVEPDPLFRLLLCAAMAGEFADFHAVATYNEARALLAEHEFAAIVAENGLAGGAGLSLYEEVRRTKPTLPFALMGAGITVTRDDPQFRCFPKPFGVSELTAALVQMIAFVSGR